MPTARPDRAEWADLFEFQRRVAERLLDRGRATGDIHAKFFFFFSGFNALYFLWATVDRKSLSELLHETDQIEHLLQMLDERDCQQVLEAVAEDVDYLGAKGSTHREKLAALGQTLYQLRCKLVQGQERSGGNEELIRRSVRPLEMLLAKACEITAAEAP